MDTRLLNLHQMVQGQNLISFGLGLGLKVMGVFTSGTSFGPLFKQVIIRCAATTG